MSRSALVLITMFGFAGVSSSFVIGANDDFLTAAVVLIVSCGAITYAGARLIDGGGLPRSNASSSLGAAQLTGGNVSRLFLSSRFTSSRACQPALVNVCSHSFIASEYGASDEGKIRKHDGE